MKQKKNAHKPRKLAVTLTERDIAALQSFATDSKLTKPLAIRRILRQFLADYYAQNDAADADDIQIGLFDTMQTDIFGNLTKTK